MSETEKCGASIPMGPGISAQCGLPLLHAGTHRDAIPRRHEETDKASDLDRIEAALRAHRPIFARRSCSCGGDYLNFTAHQIEQVTEALRTKP